MEKRPENAVVSFQPPRAPLRTVGITAFALVLAGSPVAAQESPDEGPTKVAGDALADYLRALAEAQAARANAETARANAIEAQATLSDSVRAATDARTVLAAVVSRLAAESGAVAGSALGLDGEWRAPARSGATAGP